MNGLNLGDPRFAPFYEACEELGMSLFIHPWDMMGKVKAEKHWLPWLVGARRDLQGGVFHDFCRGVGQASACACCFLTLGLIPAHHGRIKHGHACRPDLVLHRQRERPRHLPASFGWTASRTTHVFFANPKCKGPTVFAWALIILSRWGTWSLGTMEDMD